jgi:hypothetical protein
MLEIPFYQIYEQNQKIVIFPKGLDHLWEEEKSLGKMLQIKGILPETPLTNRALQLKKKKKKKASQHR